MTWKQLRHIHLKLHHVAVYGGLKLPKKHKAQWKKVLVMQFAEKKARKFEMKLVAKTYAVLHYKPCDCFAP